MPRLRLGKKKNHCWSHCCLPVMKRSGPQIQNGSQHIPLHASISIPAPTLLRLAREILWQAGECSSRSESTVRVLCQPRLVTLAGWAGTKPPFPGSHNNPRRLQGFNLGWLMGCIDPKSTSGQREGLRAPSREFS